MLALSVSDLDVDESSEAVNEHQRRVFEAGGDRFEAHHRRKDGTAFDVEVSARSWGTTGISVFVHDITERKQREQAQRLESLGVLAGGIAHDFNNILTAVIGNAELALADLPPSSPSRVHIVEIAHASRRAADLSQQMLAFSGRGRFVIEPVDLSALVRQLSDLLRSTISKRTALVVNLAVDLPRVQGDASQLSQLIMNLVLNASEAIGDRDGSVTVSTQAIDWPDDLVVESSSLLTLAPGTYVRFEVSDTGCGMD
jgi:signal transduction histidine kinase